MLSERREGACGQAGIDPRRLLPHRPPFLFLDAIDSISAERASGRCRFPAASPFLEGHFPGDPIVPGVLQLEAMAQLAAAMGAFESLGRSERPSPPALVAVRECTFHEPLLPDVEVVISVERESARLGTVTARAELRRASDGALVAEALIRGAPRPGKVNEATTGGAP